MDADNLISVMQTQSMLSLGLAVLMVPVSFLIQAGTIRWRMHVTFGKACLVSLVMFAILVVASIVLGGIYWVALMRVV